MARGGMMNIFYPKRKWHGRGPGVRWAEVPRLHIGWNEDDVEKWKDFPFTDARGKLAYVGGAVLVIQDDPGAIKILVVKSHTGRWNRKIGEVRVVDSEHATEITIDNPVKSYRPRPRHGTG
jgi:hypothetical protein